MQDDGNFVLYHGCDPSNIGAAYWASNTGGAGQGYAILRDDGNFVLYHGTPSNPGAAYWATNTVAGVGANLTIASGNNQIQPLAMLANGAIVAFAPLSVRLTDNIGNPLAGKQISWSANGPAAMRPQLNMYYTSATSTTNANGIATLDQLNGNSAYALNTEGAFTIVASSGSASVTFNLSVGVPPGSALSVYSNDEHVTRSASYTTSSSGIPMALFGVQEVIVSHPNGEPASGVQVGFCARGVPPGMIVQVSPVGPDMAAITTTDANGVAFLDQMGGNGIQCTSDPPYAAVTGSFTIAALVTGGRWLYFEESVVP
jgi:hypothetical protein